MNRPRFMKMLKKLQKLFRKHKLKTFEEFLDPYFRIKQKLSPLVARGNRTIKFSFDEQFRALIYYHIFACESGRELIQNLNEDPLCQEITGISSVGKSTFFDAINTRGLEQFEQAFALIYAQAAPKLPSDFQHLGKLVSIDGSLLQATLSMLWADYRSKDRKAKIHFGFQINQGIPKKLVLTDGKQDEKQYVEKLLEPTETGVLDRYYYCHQSFEQWHQQGLFFVCRIRNRHNKSIVQCLLEKPTKEIRFDALVRLGTPKINQTQTTFRLVNYWVENKEYWIVTNRFDLTAEQIALIYKLRWSVESFFQWWKRNLSVYHVIARSEHGFSVQILAGLITYLLCKIYCQNQFGENVSLQLVRTIRITIRKEAQIEIQSISRIFLSWLKTRWNFAKV